MIYFLNSSVKLLIACILLKNKFSSINADVPELENFWRCSSPVCQPIDYFSNTPQKKNPWSTLKKTGIGTEMTVDIEASFLTTKLGSDSSSAGFELSKLPAYTALVGSPAAVPSPVGGGTYNFWYPPEWGYLDLSGITLAQRLFPCHFDRRRRVRRSRSIGTVFWNSVPKKTQRVSKRVWNLVRYYNLTDEITKTLTLSNTLDTCLGHRKMDDTKCSNDANIRTVLHGSALLKGSIAGTVSDVDAFYNTKSSEVESYISSVSLSEFTILSIPRATVLLLWSNFFKNFDQWYVMNGALI